MDGHQRWISFCFTMSRVQRVGSLRFFSLHVPSLTFYLRSLVLFHRVSPRERWVTFDPSAPTLVSAWTRTNVFRALSLSLFLSLSLSFSLSLSLYVPVHPPRVGLMLIKLLSKSLLELHTELKRLLQFCNLKWFASRAGLRVHPSVKLLSLIQFTTRQLRDW